MMDIHVSLHFWDRTCNVRKLSSSTVCVGTMFRGVELSWEGRPRYEVQGYSSFLSFVIFESVEKCSS